MKTFALTSAITFALGLSTSSFANEIDALALGSDQTAATAGGTATSQDSVAASESFNRYKHYDLDVTKRYMKSFDMDYRTENTLDIGVAVAASVLVGEVSGNTLESRPIGLAWDDISVGSHGTSANTINGSHTTGISAVSQNLGHNNLNQQSAVVQVNFPR
jgi:hypothetical protein